MTDKSMQQAGWDHDAKTRAQVVDSIVLRGDLSGLGPGERARFYIQMCEGLGLNPHAQPFAFLRLNGKEILYATRGATDQLAAMHRVNRKIIDGPKVIDLAGTKLVYAVCEASLPNGRVETATATVPLSDPQNVLMKCETKAKRRATMSILGLALLDEMEIETIPAAAQEPGGGLDLSRALDPQPDTRPNPLAEVGIEQPARKVEPPPPPSAAPKLAAFYTGLTAIDLPGEAVVLWRAHRAELAAAESHEREAAWKAICSRVEEVGRMKNAKVWLKKALAEEDARAATTREPGDEGPDDEPPAGGAGASSRRTRSGANGSAATTSTQAGPVGLVESWMGSEEGVRGYLSQRAHWNALENAVRKHSAVIPAHLQDAWGRMATWRLQTLSADATGAVLALDGPHGCKALVAKWRAEGPRREVAQRAAAAILTTAAQLGMVA